MSGLRRRQFKICLIGDGYVGKTSIRREYLKEGFKRSYIPTLGVDFAQKAIEYEGVPTNLVIWDIAGQSLFQNLRKRYYDGSSGLILVYSVIDRTAFENASKWLVEAHGYMGKLPPVIIVGNKVDLRSSALDKTISTKEGQEFAKKISADLNAPSIFIETSALTGENIDDAFEALVGMMIEEWEKRQPGYVPKETAPEPTPAPVMGAPVTETQTQEEIQSQPTSIETGTQEGVHPQPTSIETRTAEAILSQPNSEIVKAASSIERSPDVRVEKTVSLPTTIVDPITSLTPDSEYLLEEEIGGPMSELTELRARLKRIEEDLADSTTELEKRLVNLRNVIHVKKIMYEHLRQQLAVTRKEWTDAYDEYIEIDKRKRIELAKRSKELEDVRSKIDDIGKTIRKKVGKLDMKKMSD